MTDLARLRDALVPVANENAAPTGLSGRASSVEPRSGDPDVVAAWREGGAAWLIDRKTMRLTAEGEDVLDFSMATKVADLVDRVQLVLGYPIEIEWVEINGRICVRHLAPLVFTPRFTANSYRRVTLLSEDDGVVSPLAVDAMSKAMRIADDPVEDSGVRRVYGRPYRRVEGERTHSAALATDTAVERIAARAARLAADVAAPVVAARRFTQGIRARLDALDGVPVAQLDVAPLVAHICDCERLCVEGFSLLDRARRAGGATLPVLDALAGVFPREDFAILAAPRVTRERRKLIDAAKRLAARIRSQDGTIPTMRNLSPAHRRAWDELRTHARTIRPVGLDVMQSPYGETDETLHAALVEMDALDLDSRERARRDILRRLSLAARTRSLGALRESIVRSIAMLIFGIADTKGEVADALASAHLRLRRGALEAGRRLVENAVLDHPTDAFYLSVSELEQALSGEPGAYAARVRLRREDDARWMNFHSPERLLSL